MRSRYEILMENYCKVLHIEALTMLDMAKQQILPAVLSYTSDLSAGANAKKALSDSINVDADTALIAKLSDLSAQLYAKVEALDEAVAKVPTDDVTAEGVYYKDNVLTAMADVRAVADKAEALTSSEYWPFPTYGDLLFSIQE